MKFIACLLLITSILSILPCVEGADQVNAEETDSLPIVWHGVPNEWLVEKVATKENILTKESSGKYGWSEKAIRLLQAKTEAEDEIWFFDNRLLAKKAGRIGFALVRKGKTIAHIVTVIS